MTPPTPTVWEGAIDSKGAGSICTTCRARRENRLPRDVATQLMAYNPWGMNMTVRPFVPSIDIGVRSA